MILEQIHQFLGNLVRTLTLHKPMLTKMNHVREYCLHKHLQSTQKQIGSNFILCDVVQTKMSTSSPLSGTQREKFLLCWNMINS